MKTETKRPIESYEHRDKRRVNNPPVGLVTPDTDPDTGQKKKTYAYDPHLDPQLVWAGKAEHTSFEVPTVSLHVHERIDPRTIIEAVRKGSAGVAPAGKAAGTAALQLSLFEEERHEPLRSAIEFYQHKHGWSNRLIAGDSLLVMNSLLEKEGMAGKVQMIYIDPPYGIKYGSNFQPFVNKRDVKDGKDEDLTCEPEQIRAFRDTWELGIHSYLTYLRDRLLLARELLTESGSIFVQISDENLHHVRELMDEVFGAGKFCGLITFRKTVGQTSKLLAGVADFLLWYSRDREKVKFRRLMRERRAYEVANAYRLHEMPDGSLVPSNDKRGEPVQPLSPTSQTGSDNTRFGFEFEGVKYYPPGTRGWSTSSEGMNLLRIANRLTAVGGTLIYKRYLKDANWVTLSLLWDDTMQSTFATENIYVVQTYSKVIQRCLLMTTDPGDLVFDPTCGSGTTAFVAEQWGRRWITCDTSRVALTLARQRLMTAVFDYYELAHPEEGVGSGFKYKTVPHVTLKSIANNPEIDGIHARWTEKLYEFLVASFGFLDREWVRQHLEKAEFGLLEQYINEAAQANPELETKNQKLKTLLAQRREQIDAGIARHAPQETLYDQPLIDRKKVRVTGPFTVEAVPSPAVKSVEDIVAQASPPAHARHEAAEKKRAGETPALRSGWHDRGYLPHLKAEGGTYFVTFRLADTLPKEVLEQYQFEREDIIKRAEAMGRELSPYEENRLAELYSERIESYLEAGCGKCWLKIPEIARMMVDTLLHFDGSRYDLHAWVVMPNHVHVVVTPRKDYTLSNILHSWNSFTAHEVQKVAQASRLQLPVGKAFWQRESYDHLVRDEADFARVCEYTIQNPVKAGLCEKPEEWPFSSASAALVASFRAGETPALPADASVARSGETLRQAEWRDELLRAGIRGKAGQHIRFARLEPLPGCRWLHADGETRPSAEGADSVREDSPAYNPMRVVVSFGPEHAPLEQRQVEHAWEEARTLVPRPKLLVFAAFQFDPEAAKDIDELKPETIGMQLLKVQMNADLLTDDLKKKRASNESFWLIGQPDVEVSSYEFLVFSDGERMIAECGTFKKLSGLGSLEEINRLGWQDLFFYALLSQGRDIWAYLADQEGWDFHTGQYRGRPVQKQQRGVPPVSWNSPGLIGGIGDIVGDLKEFGVSDIQRCRRIVDQLRGNQQIAGGLKELAQNLNFPIAAYTNWQLKTKNLHRVAVHGFDYYNTKSGQIESGGEDKIAVWLLDTDYDGRSLYPRQVFFPMAGPKDGWARLAKNLKAEIDEERIEAYRGTVSLPFEPGEHRRIAVKIVDDRGIESLKVMGVEP